jgi:hypothetical protein
MIDDINIKKLKASWTKYDIVQVMSVIDSLDILDKYLKEEAIINLPIFQKFLGVKSLSDNYPEYWREIQKFQEEKKLFALLAVIFTHIEVIDLFANEFAKGNMQGVFKMMPGSKMHTNIRSALVESGAAANYLRRNVDVPYDLTPVFSNPEVGKLFKKLLIDRIYSISSKKLSDSEFYEFCFENNFHLALSLTINQFKNWLEGESLWEDNYLQQVIVNRFYAIDNLELNFEDSKEIYFLGENGDGKTLILMAIYLAFNGFYVSEKADQKEVGLATDMLYQESGSTLLGKDKLGREYMPDKGNYINKLFAYGTHRGRVSPKDTEKYGFMTLFSTEEKLTDPENWLLKLYTQRLKVANDNYSVIKDNAEILPLKQLESIIFELLERNVEVVFENGELYFNEKGALIKFNHLSEGYKSIIIFAVDLFYRLLNVDEEKKDYNHLAIVLIDEIDLHLHPKWQRVIVKKLRTIFPQIQFIFTTHSPTMIQGASEDALIFKVYRNDNDGFTKVSEPFYRKNLDHLMINTLVTSPLFGMSDSRMNTDNENADTSDTYLSYRINKILDEELEKQKASGKKFISDAEIDALIKEILNEELGQND